MKSAPEFTAESFIQIAALETRKGRRDPALRFDDVRKVVQQLVDLRVERRKASRGLWHSQPEAWKDLQKKYRDRALPLRAQKEALLRPALQALSDEIALEIDLGSFSWGLRAGIVAGGKPTYRLAESVKTYFAAKQVESSLRAATWTLPSNRDQLVSALRQSLAGDLPHGIIRTDISSFFESIPHADLLEALRRYPSLSWTVRSLVEMLLREYAGISGKPTGLPRGVGISAHLSEAFLQPLDTMMLGLPGVLFYGRFVDDIVMVLETENHLDPVKDRLRVELTRLGLQQNIAKTKVLRPSSGSVSTEPFEYLGYKIRASQGHVSVGLARKKVLRYRWRIDRAFEAWDRHAPASPAHERLLLQRVMLLTGNIRLTSANSRGMAGSYFSNRNLNDMSCLIALDRYLSHRAAKSTMPDSLRTSINELTFIKGHSERMVHRFKRNDLLRIAAVWKNEP
jgi:hypothetical protein